MTQIINTSDMEGSCEYIE